MRYPTLIGSLVLLTVAGCQNNTTPESPARRSTITSADVKPGTKTTAKGEIVETNVSALHHPVSTKDPAAQQAFNDGLALVYAFNHDEAIKSFQHALELDPNLAMAHWGIALALGPNYNIDVDAEREVMAYEEIQKAKSLMTGASQPEKDYIEALAVRYSNDPKADLKQLAQNYNDAMRKLAKKYPDDTDAATLFADSGMVLRPWNLWTKDYKPQPGTMEIVATLEGVLYRDPDHIGANHLYIHAVEGSDHPEWALESAGRLPALAPSCGHLVHMPSHVYIRTGDYAAASGSNEQAVEVDEAYIKARPKLMNAYTMMYYSHNLHFLAVAAAIEGRYTEAKKSADALAAHVGPMVPHMPPLEGFMPTPIIVDVRFQRWDDILKSSAPPESEKITTALWHFARGMAYADKNDPAKAADELKQLDAIAAELPPDTMYGMLNKAGDVLAIAHDMLAAKIAYAKSDRKSAIALLESAAKREDALNYAEPPDWYVPTRPALAMVLLADGNAVEAEKVCRVDLALNRRYPITLFALTESLKAQGKAYEAAIVEREYKTAYEAAEKPLTLEDLF